jgi:NADH-quinone oxidoreductase subunit K
MIDVGLGHYLVVSAILLVLGIFGIFLNRKNVIIILMSIELILLAVNLNFVAFSAALNDLAGQVMAMLVLTVAAAEAAIGLAIVVIYFRNRGSIQVEDVNLMKGLACFSNSPFSRRWRAPWSPAFLARRSGTRLRWACPSWAWSSQPSAGRWRSSG